LSELNKKAPVKGSFFFEYESGEHKFEIGEHKFEIGELKYESSELKYEIGGIMGPVQWIESL